MSFKFSKQNKLSDNKIPLGHTAGEFAVFELDKVNNDPKGAIRDFTIASSPTEDFIMISTRIKESSYKQRLSDLTESTKIKISETQGQFILHKDYSKPAVFLSGGIGVTPFRSMIKYATDKQLPLEIIVFDSNKNINNILYKKEFDKWLEINKKLKIIYSITDDTSQKKIESHSTNEWKGEYGRINKNMILKYINDTT